MNIDLCKQLPNQHLNQEPVIIIGAGWSGIACAVTLVQQGYKVCLLESARQVGGRARSINIDELFCNQPLDNGQHIMLGAYHYTRKILATLGLDEADILQRKSLELEMYSFNNKVTRLKVPALPAPLHLLYALLSLTGVSLKDRFSAIRFAITLALSHYRLKEDVSVSSLLKHHNQSSDLIKVLWEPLCLATMNTPIHYASAQVFLNVLNDSFNKKKQDSDLLFFKKDLSQFFCEPAIQYITSKSCEVLCAHKVQKLEIMGSGQFCIKTNQKDFYSHQLILATPAKISKQLIYGSDNQALHPDQSVLIPEDASFDYAYEPICTVYLQYPGSVKLPETMVGFFNTLSQWAIDRSINQQPGLIAVVISGPGHHIQMPNDQLADIIHNELTLCLRELPKPLYYKVITEKKATFSCRVNVQSQRPANQTRIPGLFLAGDYTDTHYPSTLEGAVKSGVSAARQIINTNNA